ncbi:hypothetical protein A4D02_03695 [Niastella koreensis]|uniref:Lipoprotein n=2 Tax=Niastella koreensis TaxID=354356 RepID=G8TMU3_NIAKG|nr:hypothetical protein [Niastella koreensis]AEW03114.1 hypothetical protein Niako_6892 [Niastella koreensis GR20-10]OQP55423.1 hypothetical protein A4D02_03695 [Niastella koreensis]
MRALVICFLILITAACNEPVKTNNNNPKEKFDKIESITGSDNWQLIDGVDTSYLFFSRIGNEVDVYRYTISKGDSVNTQMNNIVHRNDSVIWNWNNEKLLLTGADGNTINWQAMNTGKDACKMVKTDSVHISFVLPNGHTADLKKTLPLSVFLVRQKYDYIHGTSYTDSATILTRHPKKKAK